MQPLVRRGVHSAETVDEVFLTGAREIHRVIACQAGLREEPALAFAALHIWARVCHLALFVDEALPAQSLAALTQEDFFGFLVAYMPIGAVMLAAKQRTSLVVDVPALARDEVDKRKILLAEVRVLHQMAFCLPLYTPLCSRADDALLRDASTRHACWQCAVELFSVPPVRRAYFSEHQPIDEEWCTMADIGAATVAIACGALGDAAAETLPKRARDVCALFAAHKAARLAET